MLHPQVVIRIVPPTNSAHGFEMVDGRDHCLFTLQGFPDVLLRQLQHAPATNFIELKPQ